MRIAFIGPPGAGKSTQARKVARALPPWNTSPHLSSGDLVRAQIEADTVLGHEIRGHYERGERVPEEIILSLVLPRVRRAGGWMLDNFPADVAQACALDEELEERGAGGMSRVICLEGPSDEELVERIVSGRVTSRATGEVYHLVDDPPPRPWERLDPGPFGRREDDTEEATRQHLEVYRREADALKEHYEARGILSVVDAEGPIEEVTAEILGILGNPEAPAFYAASKGVG